MGPLQHTLDHRHCPACAETNRAITVTGEHFGELSFPRAAAVWLEGRNKISASTRKYYNHYLKGLSTFFGEMRLREIDIGTVVEYQKARQASVRASANYKAHLKRHGGRESRHDGASLINHEISCVLAPILKRAGLWENIRKFYEPLPLRDRDDGPGLALTPEEEDHFFEIARRDSRWELAYYGSLLSRSSAAGPGEIKGLRLRDLELDHPVGPVLKVRKNLKTKERERVLVLNSDAERAVRWMLERATAKCGAHLPGHYLLPHRAERKGEGWDPSRPMGSWKKAFWTLTREAAKKYPRLATLRPYDMRHTASTDLMEDARVSWTTVEDVLGHKIDSATKRIYNHVRDERLKAAMNALHRGHAARLPLFEPLKKRPASSSVQTPAKPKPNSLAARMAKAAAAGA
jgi:integrase